MVTVAFGPTCCGPAATVPMGASRVTTTGMPCVFVNVKVSNVTEADGVAAGVDETGAAVVARPLVEHATLQMRRIPMNPRFMYSPLTSGAKRATTVRVTRADIFRLSLLLD